MNFKNMRSFYLLVFLSTLLSQSVGCGGSGGSSGGAPVAEEEDPVVEEPIDPPDIADSNQAPLSNAGSDQEFSRLFTVDLDGTASSDADGDSLSYSWRQTQGPDVTGGIGTLQGATPSFPAPDEVATLVFELKVNDGVADSETDTVVVNVFEDQHATYFVDGDNGSDEEGTGSRELPFKSIAKAICELTDDQQDIYVMSRDGDAQYDETIDPCPGEPLRDQSEILSLPTGTSLYGGYDNYWHRHHLPKMEHSGDAQLDHLTGVTVSHYGVRFQPVNLDAWLSGFDIQTMDSPDARQNVHAVYSAGGTAKMYVIDNVLHAGNVGIGEDSAPGSSYGLVVALMESAEITRNTIFAGMGGDGKNLEIVFDGSATVGGDASGESGGDGTGEADYDGGIGGSAGTGPGSNGSTGGHGEGPAGQGGCGGGANDTSSCYDGRGDASGAQNGRPGQDGSNGGVGSAGDGATGFGLLNVYEDGDFFAYFRSSAGNQGGAGTDGGGGGGGGGGEASALGVNGGRGGGGGGGGAGGIGGQAGAGGGASIGILVASVNNLDISNNLVSCGMGGIGATGGKGQVGGGGGSGANGSPGNGGIGTGGTGGTGGYGGIGGNGGRGGAGTGGPSFGILIGENTTPTITGNKISSGDGGVGGNGGVGGKAGEGGYSYALFDANTEDDAYAADSNNELSFGVAGAGGETDGMRGVAQFKNW